MTERERYILILAGGRGERFWPWSLLERPKQLLPLGKNGITLLAATLQRALRLVPRQRVIVLTASALKSAVERECQGTGALVLAEPMLRNTGPAIGAFASWLSRRGDPAFVVMPSDHAIDDDAAFTADVERAFEVAERDDVLVTFGIRPSNPDTNFGYIQTGERVDDRLNRVSRFAEKPDLAKAEEYVRGGYVWNSGIFVWRTSVFLKALEAAEPSLAASLRPLASASEPTAFERSLGRVFPQLDPISVDHAVLEKASNVVVIEAAFDWDDLGSWGAWARRQPRDARGNVTYGSVVVLDCDGCVVVGDGGTAAAIGLKDMVVVNANGSTLCCKLADSAAVRRIREIAEAARR